MDGELDLQGKKYISSKRLSTSTGYTHDYISRLCREKKIDGALIGRNWYVNPDSLALHKQNIHEDKEDEIEEVAQGVPSVENSTSDQTENEFKTDSSSDKWENFLFDVHGEIESENREMAEGDRHGTQADEGGHSIIPILLNNSIISPRRTQFLSSARIRNERIQTKEINQLGEARTFFSRFPVLLGSLLFFISLFFGSFLLFSHTDNSAVRHTKKILENFLSEKIIVDL